MRDAILGLSVLFLVASCVGLPSTESLTEAGQNVNVINAQQAEQCDALGEVEGIHSTALTMEAERESAMNDARNSAADLGANAILVESRSSNQGGSVVTATAFNCP